MRCFWSGDILKDTVADTVLITSGDMISENDREDFEKEITSV